MSPFRKPRHLLMLAAALAALALAGCGDDESPLPQVGKDGGDEAAATKLGFPAFATKNTTRVGGADPIADAAGVALAVYPSTGGVDRPETVAIARLQDWQGALAASVLASEALRAPILLSEQEKVPDATREALETLQPRGGSRARDAQVLRIADAPSPPGLRARRIKGSTPAAVAAAVAKFQARVSGRRPRRFVAVSQNAPEFAMPAAAWAARSGDPIIFVGEKNIPAPTRALLRRYDGATVQVLGPSSVVSSDAVRALRKDAGSVKRVSGETAVENAVAFARHLDGSFGWNINDPGHGLVIANAKRPADAAAAAPLSAAGKPGPLLLVDRADRLPPELEQFLLDIKPGYRDDPSRAVYNHAWLMGDEEAIDIAVQAQIDELAELVKIRAGGSSRD